MKNTINKFILIALSIIITCSPPDEVIPEVKNFSATPLSDHEIELTWSALSKDLNEYGLKYVIYRTSVDGDSKEMSTTDTEYTDEGLKINTNYDYAIIGKTRI